jgi:ferredoxin--NADP+ reductase
MVKELTYNATLIGRQDYDATLALFRVRPDQPLPRPDGGGLPFAPGQYVTLGLNAEPAEPSRPVSVQRPMSIASAPEDEQGLDFYIKRVERPESDLPFTHLLWPLAPGARLFLRPAATGKFTLADTCGVDDRRTKVFVAAGTGLAPFVSIIRSRVASGASLVDLVLLHGASRPEQLGYLDELRGLERTHGLRYVPTISRPHEAPTWSGARGRVEELFAPAGLEAIEAELGLRMTPAEAVVLICGLTGTIRNTVLGLIPRGFIPDHRRIRQALGVPAERPASVFYEQYDSEPVIDLKDDARVATLRAQLEAASLAEDGSR